ncbi:hypothetical protein GWK47_034849 [Chionoecetes opilio]|uniref:Uncharacterized protein n=1 Tax=Chionoecetes opilio TaxID=41210 RepID=A0A8J5CNX1_CHIOP|nr:hypothetical protein GWK47_034849 [Chionoecetes opilio]
MFLRAPVDTPDVWDLDQGKHQGTKIVGLGYDGRKDKTRAMVPDSYGKLHPRLIREEHVSVTEEPSGRYFWHFVPEDPVPPEKPAFKVAQALYDLLVTYDSTDSLINLVQFIINAFCNKCFTVELVVCVDDIRFAYLGHIISHDMTNDDDIIKQTTKLLVVGNTLQRKFSYCSREVEMELFRSHCYSIYCKSLWSRFKVATLNRLKLCHNDILKRYLGRPRWSSSSLAFARSGVNNLDVIRRHAVFNLRSRVELSANSIITSIRQSSAYVCGPIQQRWLGLLFVQNVV